MKGKKNLPNIYYQAQFHSSSYINIDPTKKNGISKEIFIIHTKIGIYVISFKKKLIEF
jgi:hypothetical protein